MDGTSMNCDHRRTEALFDKLQASSEGWERSRLLLQLIDALNVCMDGEGLFYPWRHTTRKERALRSAEATEQRQVARQALHDVLVDDSLSFEMRVRILRYLIHEHIQLARAAAISEVEEGMSSGHLEIIGSRVSALHSTTPAIGRGACTGSRAVVAGPRMTRPAALRHAKTVNLRG